MKQRLLLSLLMLFVSVGFLKASIDIKLPEKGGTVTISLRSEDNAIFTTEDYPHLFVGTVADENKLSEDNIKGFKSSTLTYTYTSEKAATLSFSTLKDRFHEEWGNIFLTISGPVESLITTGGDWNKYIVGFTLQNNGGILRTLALAANYAETGYFPNLTTLVIPENKLALIPAKTDKMTNYSVGKVNTTGISLKDDARSFLLDADQLFASILSQLKNVNPQDISIKALYKDGKVVTDVKMDKVESVYHFLNSSGIFISGEYTADLEITGGDWKGIIVGGVTLNIDPAKFMLTIKGTDATKVGVEVSPNADNYDEYVWKEGDKITLKPTQEAGSSFGGFKIVQGLEEDPAYNEEGNSFVYIVKGDKDPVIEVKTNTAKAKISYSIADSNGSMNVWYNNAQLQNGMSVPCGDKISITADAKENFQIKDVTVNGESILDKDTKKDDPASFDATIEVPNVKEEEEIKIVVSFEEATHILAIDRPTNIWEYFTVKGNNVEYCKTAATSGQYKGLYVSRIPEGTPLTISMKLIATKKDQKVTVQINGEDPEHWEKVGEGAYVIKDFVMPKGNSKITVTVGAYEKITITLDKTELVYDGTKQQVPYSTDPKGITMEAVKYVEDVTDSYESEEGFSKVGNYMVRFYRDADDTYAALEGKTANYDLFDYKIVPADLVIMDLPTISVDSKTKKYTIIGGKAGYKRGEELIPVDGKFIALDNAGRETPTEPADANGKVTVRFVPVDAEKANFRERADAPVIYNKDAKDVSVSVYDAANSALVLMNDMATVGSSVKEGTMITFKIKDEDPHCIYHVYLVDENGNQITGTTDYKKLGFEVGTTFTKVDKLIFKLVVDDSRSEVAFVGTKEQTYSYTGKVQAFKVATKDLKTKDGNKEVPKAFLESYFEITYYQNGVEVEPIDAGDYDVVLSRIATDHYKAFEVSGLKLHIDPIDVPASIKIPAPTSTRISKNSPLKEANLIGTPDIKGKYHWVEADKIVSESGSALVYFDPESDNYNNVMLETPVTYTVTDKAILKIFVPDGMGTVIVRDVSGAMYGDGDFVRDQTQLTVTATPNDPNKVELESLKIGNQTYTTSPQTFTFGTSTVEITATFKAKSTEEIDPNSQYKVTVTESVRGAIISKPGDNVVKLGSDFDFTVSTLAADASKVVVKVDGTTLKPTNGKYVIQDVKKNTTVTVSLPNPTPLKVEVQKDYLNANKYHIGQVEIIDGEATSYYYGDVITVMADPEDGVKFVKWSDGSTDKIHEITLKADTKVVASFSGVPTGIEDIESAAITTGKGFIMVKNVANAKVTVVSISGRLQAQEEVSGDTRIDVPQGIYVVVLESGSDVKRTKVIVK